MAADLLMPKYPVYIPSKGRSDHCLVARELIKDKVPFRLVVEPQEKDIYAARFGDEKILVLPENDQGLVYARNWIKKHATAESCARHWQLDDNLYGFYRTTHNKMPPFYLNHHVYSCTLILNSLPNRWRGIYNEDVDMCLQVLADGWCTILMNAFLAKKKWTMQMRGGNTDRLYQGDGRLKMARALERLWPGVVETHRRFKRPQHVVFDSWKRFDTPLKLKRGIDPAKLGPSEHGIKLVAVQPIKSKMLQRLVSEYAEKHGGVRAKAAEE
jgi:hypothetical protein